MILFILGFILIYGTLHGYFFIKMRAAFGWHPAVAVAVLLFFLLMTTAPVLVRILESHAYEHTGRALAIVGYTWMGLLFLFVTCSLAVDLYRGGIFLLGKIMHQELGFIALSARAAFFIPVTYAIALALYGFFEANNIRTEYIKFTSPKLATGSDPVRVVQISDVHLGLIVRNERLEKILEAVRKANPDIVVSTGDFVDGQLNNLSTLVEPLKNLQPRFGKYAITGNHEFYAGLDQSLDFTRRSGFHLLRGDYAEVAGIIIAGVDDPAGRGYDSSRSTNDRQVLSRAPHDRFVLFLKHRPIVNSDAAPLFDLQLSGHVHHGQIYPFRLLSRLFYPMPSGMSTLAGGSSIYVSRGTGTWGPPFRFLAPPEVTVIDIIPASSPVSK